MIWPHWRAGVGPGHSGRRAGIPGRAAAFGQQRAPGPGRRGQRAVGTGPGVVLSSAPASAGAGRAPGLRRAGHRPGLGRPGPGAAWPGIVSPGIRAAYCALDYHAATASASAYHSGPGFIRVPGHRLLPPGCAGHRAGWPPPPGIAGPLFIQRSIRAGAGWLRRVGGTGVRAAGPAAQHFLPGRHRRAGWPACLGTGHRTVPGTAPRTGTVTWPRHHRAPGTGHPPGRAFCRAAAGHCRFIRRANSGFQLLIYWAGAPGRLILAPGTGHRTGICIPGLAFRAAGHRAAGHRAGRAFAGPFYFVGISGFAFLTQPGSWLPAAPPRFCASGY